MQSIFTAATVAGLFVVAGRPLLRLLGVTASDFMIAGGALLFVLSLGDLMSAGPTQRKVDPETVGAVPIAVMMVRKGVVALLVQMHGG